LNNSKLAYGIYVILIANKELIKKTLWQLRSVLVASEEEDTDDSHILRVWLGTVLREARMESWLLVAINKHNER
jgi:hypothetical protein